MLSWSLKAPGGLYSGNQCNEVLYKRYDNVQKPIKTIAYQMFLTSLGLLFQNSETAELLQHWKQADDAQPHGLLSREVPFLDKADLLHGLSQGSAWRSYGSDAMRWIGADGYVEDVKYHKGLIHVTTPFVPNILHCAFSVLLFHADRNKRTTHFFSLVYKRTIPS